jgi:hypothetical protein
MKFDKVLKEAYDIEHYAATNTRDVKGIQKKDKKIVRRVIKNPVTHIGSIKI